MGPNIAGAASAESFPFGQCFNWVKHGKCKFADLKDCSFEHKEEHKGKFPNAEPPQRRSRGS